MLKPFLRAWAFLALADPSHRLAALVGGRGPTPDPHPDPARGVVGRWLTDPAGTERRLLGGLGATVSGWWATWHLLLVAAAVALVVARVGLAWWRARAWRRAREGGWWLQVVPPPVATTDQGRVLWKGLAGLIRPGWLGRHLRLIGWEVHADGQRLAAGLWLPSTVDAGQVGRTVTSSYPRARITAGARGRRPAPSGLAAARPAPTRPWSRPSRGARRPVSAGYLVVPASMWAPLLADPDPGGRSGELTADRLRGAYQALASTPAGYRAVLQILARPLPASTARTARRVCRAGGGPPGPGLPARGLLAVLNLAQATVRAGLDITVPGPPTRGAAARATATRPTPTSRVGVDAVTAQGHRDTLAKASGELVEVCVRVVVSGLNRTTCRAKAFEIVNALRGPTAQPLHAIRLPHAQPTVAGRDLGNWRAVGPLTARAGHRRGWFVATPAEVGGLARLPHQPALYRFDTATAPHLPAPPGIPLLPDPDDEHDNLRPAFPDDRDGGLTGEAA